MHDPASSSGVTYIGPRSFAIAFGATCALFAALLLGINFISCRFSDDAPAPVAAYPASLPVVAASAAPPLVAAAPVTTARPVAASAPVSVPLVPERPAASPRVLARAALPVGKIATLLVAAPTPTREKPKQRVPLRAPNVGAKRVALRQRAVTALPVRPVTIRAPHTPAGGGAVGTSRLLVPFGSAMRPSDAEALQPSTSQSGSLLVVPRPALVPAAAAPPASAPIAPIGAPTP